MFTEFEFEDDRLTRFGETLETVNIRSIKGTKKKHENGYDFVDPLDKGKKYKCLCVICDKHLFTLDFCEVGEDRLIANEMVVTMGNRVTFICSKQCKDLFILTPLEI